MSDIVPHSSWVSLYFDIINSRDKQIHVHKGFWLRLGDGLRNKAEELMKERNITLKLRGL